MRFEFHDPENQLWTDQGTFTWPALPHLSRLAYSDLRIDASGPWPHVRMIVVTYFDGFVVLEWENGLEFWGWARNRLHTGTEAVLSKHTLYCVGVVTYNRECGY